MTKHEEDEWAMKYLDALKAKDELVIQQIEMNPELIEIVTSIKAHLRNELYITQFRNLLLREQVRHLEHVVKPAEDVTRHNFKWRYHRQMAADLHKMIVWLDQFEQEFKDELPS